MEPERGIVPAAARGRAPHGGWGAPAPCAADSRAPSRHQGIARRGAFQGL